MGLEISKIRVNKVKNTENKSKVVAMVSVYLNEIFVINKISVKNGSKGLFVSMPQSKNAKGEWEDICNPVNKEFRETLNKSIMEEFNKINGTEEIKEVKKESNLDVSQEEVNKIFN